MYDNFGKLIPNAIPGMQFKVRMCRRKRDSKRDKMPLTANITSLISMRTLGDIKDNYRLTNNFGTRRMITNSLFFEEQVYNCETDKVFSSVWLDDRQVLFGTKCKKLKVLDVVTKNIIQIPTLRGSNKNYNPSDSPCGMHSIQVNPSKTLLATGAKSSANIAIYRLPSLEPLCVGENGHGDWVFDIVWLDDEFFATGGRDSKISLWQVYKNEYKPQYHFPSHFFIQPTISEKCQAADKIRALAFNKKHLELAALSINARLHVWDVHSFKQKQSYFLRFQSENVCLRLHEQRNFYAIGSKSHITIMDADTLLPTFEIVADQPGCSIRSLSFDDDLLTIGTGTGTVMFYDLRARKYLQTATADGHPRVYDEAYYAKLMTSRGVVRRDRSFWDMFHGQEDYRPAIYTHSYDTSGTRLFVAGGPLPANLQGCYLGIWR